MHLNRPKFKKLILSILFTMIESPLRLFQLFSIIGVPDQDNFNLEDDKVASLLVRWLTKEEIFDLPEPVIEYMVELYTEQVGSKDFVTAVSYYLLESGRFDHL